MAVSLNDLAEEQLMTISYLRLGHSLMLHESLGEGESCLPITVDFWPTLGMDYSAFQQESAFHLDINQR
jgi:hypothetical protein